METILIATDFSKRAECAFEHALLLASQHQAKICLLNIIDESLPEEIICYQKNIAEKILQNNIEGLRNKRTIDIEIRVGKKSIEIIKSAREKRASLIILGAHDEAYEDFFCGTTNEQVIRMGDTPVLTVKQGPKNIYQRVAIAVDFSPQSQKALTYILQLLPAAEIHLIHAYQVSFIDSVFEADDELKLMVEKRMAEEFGTLNINDRKINFISGIGETTQVIRQKVDALKPDLLTLGTHGRAGIKLTMIGSTAENLLKNPPCDILTVKCR